MCSRLLDRVMLGHKGMSNHWQGSQLDRFTTHDGPFGGASIRPCEWEHADDCRAIVDAYEPRVEQLQELTFLRQIGATTYDLYAMFYKAFPVTEHPDLYREFPSGPSHITPVSVLVGRLLEAIMRPATRSRT